MTDRLRMYRLMNLGVGEANAGSANRLGQPFPICDACLPNYDPSITNNIDARLVEDLQERVLDGATCRYHGHKALEVEHG